MTERGRRLGRGIDAAHQSKSDIAGPRNDFQGPWSHFQASRNQFQQA